MIAVDGEAKFEVIVDGVVAGESIEVAARRLADKLDGSPSQLATILSTPGYVVARDLAEDDAQGYAEAFRSSGALARVQRQVAKLAIALPAPSTAPTAPSDADIIRRLADYERISGILWLILGIVQVLSIIGILAGIWNIPAAIGRLRMSRRIRARDETVPADYEGIVGLVVLSVINVLVGGVIGVALAAFDFVIRDRVLKHRALFTEASTGKRKQPLRFELEEVMPEAGAPRLQIVAYAIVVAMIAASVAYWIRTLS